MKRHVVTEHGTPCSCGRPRRVIYVPRTGTVAHPYAITWCTECDQPVPTTPREPR